MKINAVITNLENTIAGKVGYLSTLNPNGLVNTVATEVLKLNIQELKDILGDLLAVREAKAELLSAIEEVEIAHFRTIHDTGGNPNAMLVMNAFRSEAKLPGLGRDDLPKWNEASDKYLQPIGSKLIHRFAY